VTTSTHDSRIRIALPIPLRVQGPRPKASPYSRTSDKWSTRCWLPSFVFQHALKTTTPISSQPHCSEYCVELSEHAKVDFLIPKCEFSDGDRVARASSGEEIGVTGGGAGWITRGGPPMPGMYSHRQAREQDLSAALFRSLQWWGSTWSFFA
jgi:hypothetical protein